jgi:hypothetical protein
MLDDFLKSMETTIELAKKLETQDIETLETECKKYPSTIMDFLHSILDMNGIKNEFQPQDKTVNQIQEQILSVSRDISEDVARSKNRAKVYRIFTDRKYYDVYEYHDSFGEDFQNILKQELKNNNIIPSFGDFIVDEAADHMDYNDGVTIWDGNNLIVMCWDDIGEHGLLPDNFSVWVPHPEKGFIIPPRYWDFIKHSNLTRFNHKQHIKNMVMKYDNILLGGFYALYVTWDNIHFIVFDMTDSSVFEFPLLHLQPEHVLEMKKMDYLERSLYVSDLNTNYMLKPFSIDEVELLKNEFAELLENDSLMFEYETESYLYHHIKNDNVLFLNAG